MPLGLVKMIRVEFCIANFTLLSSAPQANPEDQSKRSLVAIFFCLAPKGKLF